MRTLVLATACLLACGPATQPQSPGTAAQEPGVEPQAADPASDKDMAGWVLRTLISGGYRCNEDFPTQTCMTEDDSWVVNVTTRGEGDRWLIMFDSYLPRTTQAQCHMFNNQMAALHSDSNLFSVGCSDSSGQFRMNTTLEVVQDLDLLAWMEEHRRSRYGAQRELASASAL